MWLRTITRAAIDMVVPQITGTIEDVTHPQTSNNFLVKVRVFVDVVTAGKATLAVVGSWAEDARASRIFTLHRPTQAIGNHSKQQMLVLNLMAENVPLWWPNGHGPSTQTLHNLTTSLTLSDGSSSVVHQQIGFRTFEFVGSVGNNTERWGEKDASLWFKVNGSPMCKCHASRPAQH